jgi:valyl-tRNA synthetase
MLVEKALAKEAFTATIWVEKNSLNACGPGKKSMVLPSPADPPPGASCDWNYERFTWMKVYPKRFAKPSSPSWKRPHLPRPRMINWSPRYEPPSPTSRWNTQKNPVFCSTSNTCWQTAAEILSRGHHRPETSLAIPRWRFTLMMNAIRSSWVKKWVVPMLGRRIPVIADEYVDRAFGTGAVKITPPTTQ